MIKCILNTDPDKRFTISQIRNHSWFKQIFSESSLGILVGYNPIPINTEILNKLNEYNFDIEHSQKCIEANKHNHITTTYYLLIKKFQASPGVVESPLEKNYSENLIFPHPPLMPFAPMLANNTKPNNRHRKYIEKKIESTGGSSFRDLEVLKQNSKAFVSHSPNSNKKIISSSAVKQIRSRRYVSTGRTNSKEPTVPKPNQSRPLRVAIKVLVES